ncbi:hypothetical protein DFH08DRAFT_950350 [Mycena albidolilacea]|uniref:Uncharacterized protein n=1 Tax=Mycena albidolilacea TaxID=1033008 RepID=A0AAD7F4E8_9AGAR|nr:hypothetical protein DFH08DRAFT_950350 [Mycena albidolilacea]
MSPIPRLECLTVAAEDAKGWAPNSAAVIRDVPLLRYANLNFVPQVDILLEHLTTLHYHYAFDTIQASLFIASTTYE